MLRKKDIKNKAGAYVGSEIIVKVKKSRYVRPHSQIKFYLDYERGLSPLYGLGEIAEVAGLIKKIKVGSANHYRIYNPAIPEAEWITVPCALIDRKDAIGTILEPLNEWIKANFTLGSSLDDDEAEIDPAELDSMDDEVLDEDE